MAKKVFVRMNWNLILIYQLANWLVICFGYSIVVRPDPFIGLVVALCLFTNSISFVLLIILNKLLLKLSIKRQEIYYLTLFIFMFLANQLSYLFISRPLPVLDLNDSSTDYYQGENLLFTFSSVLCSMVIIGFDYLNRKQRQT